MPWLVSQSERGTTWDLLATTPPRSSLTRRPSRLIRWALELVEGERGPLVMQAAELWLKLGDIFLRCGRFAEARPALQEASRLSLNLAPVLAARAYCSLGSVETSDHHHDEAFGALNAAVQLLEAIADKDADDWLGTWLDVQFAQANVHYWRNEAELQSAVLAQRAAGGGGIRDSQAKGALLHVGWRPALPGQPVPDRREHPR